MFKFLKLRNSDSGDALRHVPFESIIHKPLFVLIALVFSFVAIVPIKVQAAAPQLHPEFKPILDTDIVNFQDSYLNLDPAAQAAANILFGAYVTEYAGLADYGTVFDEVPTDGTVWDRLEFAGQQLVDTFFLPYNMADQLVLSPLINLGQGIVNYVKSVDDVTGFKNDIIDASSYGLSYSPDIGFALNQVFAREGGLYNWQFDTKPFNYPFSWTQFQNTIPDVAAATYNQYLSDFDGLRIFANGTGGRIYNLLLNLPLNFHFNILIGPSFVHAYDDTGNKLSTVNESFDWLDYYYNNNVTVGHGTYTGIKFKDFSFSNISGIQNIINAYCNSNPVHYNNAFFFSLDRIVDHVYVGNDWSTKQEVFNDTDLGFANTDSLELLNPIKDVIFDLKGLIEQIVDAEPDPNYELPLQPIIYNITQVEGSPLTAEDLVGISFNVTPPESGIDVPVNVFLPFFDDGKGFISYMWYMTKPLVTYTRSFLDAITFDPVDGFNASGPGYFILGVAGLGLIGGVIVKFLL